MKDLGTPQRDSYVPPDPLVFLTLEDYARVDSEGKRWDYFTNDNDHRNPFERDRARILHSPFFRALGGKSQVFDPNQRGFFRTRLTHSLEVAQIAKVMAIEICHKYRNPCESGDTPELSSEEQIDLCDLVEAVSLAHDIGHPPFGHIGEDVLNDVGIEHGGTGFEANAQNLRVLTRLERAYPGRPGFTRGVLAGLMKYKIRRSAGLSKFIYDDDWEIVEAACPHWKHDKVRESCDTDSAFKDEVKRSRTLVCQIMDIADEITYAGHDIDDMLHTPLLQYGTIKALGTPENPIETAALEEICRDFESETGFSLEMAVLHEGWQELQSQILDVLAAPTPSAFQTQLHRLKRDHMNGASASCRAEKDETGVWRVRISSHSALRSALIRHVVNPLVHHDSRLVTLQHKGRTVIQAVFDALIADTRGELLPQDYRDRIPKLPAGHASDRPPPRDFVRVCCDFIAGMTEDYVLRFYRRLFEPDPGLLTDFF